jgi:hypothetical protein
MNIPSKKPKAVSYTNDNVIESLRDIGKSVPKAVGHDVAGRIASDVLSSLTGGMPKTGEIRANEDVTFPKETEQQPRPAVRQEYTDQRPAIAIEDHKVKQEIEAVRAELKALAASLKNLHTEVEKAIAETPVDPGVYHVNFFEKLRSFILSLKEQVEDSRTWLSLSTSRKNKKLAFWGLYKKHGTKFGLSSERTVSTQAG